MKTALITGCSSGIGAACVDAFLAAGFRVVATVRSDAAAASLRAAHERAPLHVLLLDLSSKEQRRAVGEQLSEAPFAGHLDCLVNNAGYAQFGALEDLSEAELRAQMEVNFLGTALLIRELLPLLRAARGRVINVSSLFGFVGFPLTAAYCASKYALEGLSEALYYELGPHGVQVAIVEPGAHRTNFGSNVRWPEREGATFADDTRAYRRLHARLKARGGASPRKVADAVVGLAHKRRLPLRTRVGRDASSAFLFQAALPEALVTRALSGMYGRLFRGDTP